ncbi:MAG: tetratricopeptide repeat protein [Blastocatellia bacterium]|nr:tetratricopeptide repeat protein [Blastocatellia bacterium]
MKYLLILATLFLGAVLLANFAHDPAAADALQASSRSAEDYFKQGLNLYQQGDLERAIRAYDLAIRSLTQPVDGAESIRVIDPGAAPYYYNRGVAHYDRRNWEGALADFSEALRLNPRYLLAWIKRGNIRLNLGEDEEAIADFTEALRVDPRSVLAWNNRGLARHNIGEMAAAVADYTRALDLDAKQPLVFNNRGSAKHDQGNWVGALRDYDQAIALDPRLAAAWNNRGVSRRALDDLAGAIADYTEAIRLKPGMSIAYRNRSAALKEMGRDEEARQDFVRSIGPADAPASMLEPPADDGRKKSPDSFGRD